MSASDDKALYPDLSPFETGMRGRCPRCGEGRLFKGFLEPAERCQNCGLDYAFADSGDGPAVFIIMIVGFIVVGLALVMEFTLHPPYWVHVVLWVPLVLGLSIGLLRPLKGLMIAQQYRHRAQEGRIDET
ncbi:DUF983 domain-containing protein [Bauldia litoralis]|uniref:Uncharacterized conserved protein, DUF983 family n=1 Tax=Bauldia litoralis TaxID=665467 RepID=A0A1G6C6U6_9HYPH|nr:DUF983 domain-containing protein [Bauldia litoralis]SDB28541.1 Uncharacterized conserved protein, DUF983 family [Bauldia litoralis]